jgi:formylmethanofuran dehydrogenase subunit C
MSLKRFMDRAYGGRARGRKLETRKGDVVFSLDDLLDRVGSRPSREQVEEIAPTDPILLHRLIETRPEKKHALVWGILTSLAAETSPVPLRIVGHDYAGLELSSGRLVLDQADRAGDHLGERMKGGRIMVRGRAGDYLGQEMSGGGIVADTCGNYAFRNMRGGFGVILSAAGSSVGLGNRGGRIVVRGGCGERAGWLMHGGSLRIGEDAGDYLGLLMSGGEIRVKGVAGKRAGWRMKGGTIAARGFGPEAGSGAVGGSILESGP